MADSFWFGVLLGWLANTLALLVITLPVWITRAAPTEGETDG